MSSGWQSLCADGVDEERHRVGVTVTCSRIQLKIEWTGAPIACVTVVHGTLCEGHVAFCIYEDNCIGPKMRENVSLRIKTI